MCVCVLGTSLRRALGPQLTASCLPVGDGVVRAAALLEGNGRRVLLNYCRGSAPGCSANCSCAALASHVLPGGIGLSSPVFILLTLVQGQAEKPSAQLALGVHHAGSVLLSEGFVPAEPGKC